MATIIQILGAVTVAFGVGLIYPPLGIILAGAFALVFGVALERSAK